MIIKGHIQLQEIPVLHFIKNRALKTAQQTFDSGVYPGRPFDCLVRGYISEITNAFLFSEPILDQYGFDVFSDGKTTDIKSVVSRGNWFTFPESFKLKIFNMKPSHLVENFRFFIVHESCNRMWYAGDISRTNFINKMQGTDRIGCVELQDLDLRNVGLFIARFCELKAVDDSSESFKKIYTRVLMNLKELETKLNYLETLNVEINHAEEEQFRLLGIK